MAKRGRKPAATSNSKGRPRTRSQIKPVEGDDKTPQSVSPPAKKVKKEPKTAKVKPVKEEKVKKPRQTKEKKEKSTKKSVQKTTTTVKPSPVKRGRKPKVSKVLASSATNDNLPSMLQHNDDTEEEFYPGGSTLSVPNESSNLHPSMVPSNSFAAINPDPYHFDDALEQQHSKPEPMLSKSFAQESYHSTMFNSLPSSSTSAFSAPPVQSKFNPTHQHTLRTSEANVSPIVPCTTSLPSVNIPHTPMINANHQAMLSPPQNPNMPDTAHDLPPELLGQGWRKFWSRRENRFYYFNKNTNESLWDMPKLSTQYDPMTDPLGIQSSNPTFAPPTPTDPGTPPIYPINPAATFIPKTTNINNDKKTYIGPWDFDIESNCLIWEGGCFYYFHPHPETELLRCSFMQKLRQQYYELCHSRQGIEAPRDSFSRWLWERKVHDKGCDPFLPSDCPSELSYALYNEIMNDIPIKLHKPMFSGEARKQLSKYAEAAKKIIDSPNVSANSRKIVKWNVEDAFEWIRKTLNATYEDYVERLNHLKKQCQPHIIEAAKTSVESICLKIYHVSVDYSRRVRELNLEIFKKEDLPERSNFRFPNQKKVSCFAAYLINACPKFPPIQMFQEKEYTVLRYKNSEILRLSTVYLQKLELLYYINCRDDRKYNFFLPRVWCMLKRYQTYYTKTEGVASQNALPIAVFATLNKHFGVTFECFASPLNCFFRQYCSLFPDTDGYFGSRGSIINFYPMSGSFEAFPPDCEELIDASITHFEKLLETSMEPLSFIMFIQEKPEISQKIISRLESNKFKRMHLTIAQAEHEYRHGFLHLCNRSDASIVSQHNTIVYFLQNDAGFLKWGPTPERVEELVESFKIGRDKEIPIASPNATPANAQTKPELETRPNGELV